jgi:xylulokinase
MLRAIMEGCAFAVYHGLRVAEGHGARVSEWLGDGGAARSAIWCQIKADVTGRPFVVARQADGSEGGHTLGLFALTAQATGMCTADELPGFVERLLPNRQVYQPSPVNHAMYQELFEVYRQLAERTKNDFASLAEVVGKYRLEG